MGVTIKQISELANVSRGTVDRALNNRGRIDPGVKKRILEIAKALNYTPNMVAKSLATRNKNRKIGFVLHVQHNDYHDFILQGVKKAAEEIKDFGVDVVIKEGTDFNALDQVRMIDALLEDDITDMVVVPINDPIVDQKLKELYDNGITLVLLGGNPENPDCLCHVGHDRVLQGRLAANLFGLLLDGKGDLIVFTPSLNLLSHEKVIEGLDQCLSEEYPRISIREIVQLQNDEFTNYGLVKKTLEKHHDIDAVFFTTAVLSGGLRALEETKEAETVKTVTTFYSPSVHEAMMKNRVHCAVWYNPIEVGYRSVMTLFEFMINVQEPAGKTIFTDHHILLKEGVKGTVFPSL